MAYQTKIEKEVNQATHYETDFSIGLTSQEVNARKKQGLVNKISKTVTKSYGKIIFDNLINFFNLLLFGIAALMIVAKIPWTSFAFLGILTINITIGLIQDIRARRMVDKLKVTSYPLVMALRDGKEIELPANEIVFGDIILLKTGNQIVCDGSIVEGSIEVNESILTGESRNVIKNIKDTVMSGSFVTCGKCKYRVEAVGKANYAEKLQSKAKQFKRKKSEILKTINFLFKFIGITVVVLGASLFITAHFFHDLRNDFTDSIKSISGAMVSMIPTGMYLLTSLTLAIGVIKLAKKRMLVQELYCIETLARVDVVCFDKTGTLTDGSMEVESIEVLNNNYSNEIPCLLHSLVEGTKDTNATAQALFNKYKEAPVYDIHSAVAFNSERKYSAVMLKDGRSIVLGAREFIPHKSSKIDEICMSYEKQGLRVLLLGVSKTVITAESKLKNIEPIGIIVLKDHIRDDAYENIKWFKDNGVEVKIISGDNPISVSEIAKRVGVTTADKYISLEGMSIEMVKKIANEYTVFGRVSPEQKEALVNSMQEQGHIVAMTGDGVNDILALKAADCSIAMASGSDAAKTISHLVTLDNNFSSLPDVVGEGRRVINNLQRTCSLFLVKTLFAMVMTIVFLIFEWVTKDNETYKYPFATNNMYIWELVTIGFGSLMLSLQPNNEKLGKHGFLANILTRSVPAGIVQVLLVSTYLVLYKVGVFQDLETFRTFSIVTFSVCSFVILLRISMPFDIYRVVLNVALGIITIVLLLIDHGIYVNDGKGVIGIAYNLFNNSNWWILLIVMVSSIPLYAGIETLFVRIFNKVEKRVFRGN